MKFIKHLALCFLLAFSVGAFAAFPTYTRTTGNSSADAISHTITLPATITAGQVILVVASIDGNPSTISFTNTGTGSWSSLYSTTGTNIARAAQWKVADGTEDGLTITLNLGVTQQAAWQIYLISATEGNVEVVAGGAASSTNVTFNALSPSWGAADTLWIEVIHHANGPTVSSYSTNYADGAQTLATGADITGIATATRTANTATETPGNATLSSAQSYTAYLIGVRPVAGATLTDVDTDETITSSQSGRTYTGTGLGSADGMLIKTGTKSAAATAFSATNATSGTFTAPTFASIRTGGVKFGGSVTFDIRQGGASLATLGSGTINIESGWTVHNVTDDSQEADTGTLYYGLSIDNGDQVAFASTTTTYAWPVTLDSQGYIQVDSGGSSLEDSFTYYVWDATDETWGTLGTLTIQGSDPPAPAMNTIIERRRR
jgi:hypothetical protein